MGRGKTRIGERKTKEIDAKRKDATDGRRKGKILSGKRKDRQEK